jgi:hypothetical protein
MLHTTPLLAMRQSQRKAPTGSSNKNSQLPPAERMRVVSFSTAPSGKGAKYKLNNEKWDEAVQRAETAGLLVRAGCDAPHPANVLRISMVFSVDLEYFFDPEPRPVLEIVRKKDRLRFPDSPDAAQTSPFQTAF